MTSDKKWAISTESFTNRTRNQIHESVQKYSINLKSASGKTVAQYYPASKLILKNVNESEHMLRIPTAWCFDTSVIRRVVEYERSKQNPDMVGVTFEIVAKDTKKTYTTTWEIFANNSFKHNRAGEQLALTLGHWKVIGEDFEQLEMF